jgi:hypothetical protein
MTAPPDDPSEAVLLPERRGRALLGPQRLRLRTLRPPYPALGVGELRVLRVRDDGVLLDVVVGYDRYERRSEAAR